MSTVNYGIENDAITWERTKTEIEYSDTNEVTVTAVGIVDDNGGFVSLESAVAMVPLTLTSHIDGPAGITSDLIGAKAFRPTARYTDTGHIEVTVKYRKALPDSPFGGDGGPDESGSDRAARQAGLGSAPLLTHPVAMAFPRKERAKLSSLLTGGVWVNARYDPEGSGLATAEFLQWADEEETTKEEAVFSAENVEVGGIEASPLDYARLIAAGVDEYDRPTLRHSLMQSRDSRPSDEQFALVGTLTSTTPYLAPELEDDRQWFVTALTDESSEGGAWKISYEFEATGEGGALKALYKGGTAEI